MHINSNVGRLTTQDNISVACASCPRCEKENVAARLASARSGFNATTKREIVCKQCRKAFTVSESDLIVRRYPREQIDAECGTLPWIE
jgi:transposase-like protein